MSEEKTERLNKYIAHSGICSRRAAAEHVKEGRVTINDQKVLEPGYRVILNKDVVKFRGKVIKPVKDMVYLLMNKPKNTITTANDERGRKTVLDIVRIKHKERVYPVGRLDRETTGLLLLTNDGDLANKLAHPSFEVTKIYHATLDKPLKEEHLKTIKSGFQLEDGPVQVDKVSYIKGKDKNEIGIDIHIGRNRIVRRIFENFGYEVVKLDRTYYAGLTKKDLPRGMVRKLSEKEVIMLKHFT